MQTANPLVSVITVNYNGHADTRELLASLREITYWPYEVIVVDNGSTRDKRDDFADYTWIRFVKSHLNLGFAGGNNLGIRQAKGDLILLLNNDTIVQPGFLEPMVERMVNNPAIGIVSPKILFYHHPGTIQYAGCTPISKFTARGFAIGHGKKDSPRYNKAGRTHRAHGAAMLIRKDVFDKVGLLPEKYFLYYEEMDFCETAKRAGYEIWFEPASVVEHKESMSVGKMSALKMYYMSRNRLLFIRRNFKGVSKVFSSLYVFFIAEPKEILKNLIQGKTEAARAIFKGMVWNLWHKPY